MASVLRRLLCASLVSVVSLGAVATADARRPPTTKERAAILRGVGASFGCGLYPAGSCRLVVRVSTVRPGWAAVYLRPRRGYEDMVQRDVASVRRRNGRWRAHQVGNGGGCGVPNGVKRDLRLACY
jgi:hypothetical protein